MSLKDFLLKYKASELNNSKQLTNAYNELTINDRLRFVNSLPESEKKNFISIIRKQAVADFWTHERELIQQGLSTRDWTPEQIEAIMNISEKTGVESINGHVAYDINGKAYYGHHMISVEKHPEYAGDWRNIQALDKEEHYHGAHEGGTKIANRKIPIPQLRDGDFFISEHSLQSFLV